MRSLCTSFRSEKKLGALQVWGLCSFTLYFCVLFFFCLVFGCVVVCFVVLFGLLVFLPALPLLLKRAFSQDRLTSPLFCWQTCHLDVGFADTAAGELDNYRRYLVEARNISQALKALKNPTGAGLVFTTHPYVVSLLLDCPPGIPLSAVLPIFFGGGALFLVQRTNTAVPCHVFLLLVFAE